MRITSLGLLMFSLLCVSTEASAQWTRYSSRPTVSYRTAARPLASVTPYRSGFRYGVSSYGVSPYGASYYGLPAYRTTSYAVSTYGTTASYRSYYNPLNYGYSRPFGVGLYSPYRPLYRPVGYLPYASRYSPLWGFGYGYRGFHFTRYGLYGGSFAYAPLTIGYPYNTGYLSVVRPVQPYLHAWAARPAVGVSVGYRPCVYGAYGYARY